MQDYFFNLKIVFSEKKNLLLKSRNRSSFEEVLLALKRRQLIDVLENKNYSQQYVLILKINNKKNLCVVPCKIVDDRFLVLITAFEDRKMTKKHSSKLKKDENA